MRRKIESLWLRTITSIGCVLYRPLNLILSLFNYQYLHARFNWGGRVYRIPCVGEDANISEDTVAVLCKKNGKWGRGVALRLVKIDEDKVAFRHTLFGGIGIIKYWDFGTFYFEETE